VEEELLKECKLARRLAHELLPSGGGPEIKSFVTEKFRLLSGMDKWFQIERDFWLAVIGEQGEKVYRTKILATLPGVQEDKKPCDSMKALEELRKSKLHEFVGVGCQSLSDQVHQIVRTLHSMHCPEWPVPNTDFMAYVNLRVSYFCRCEVPGRAGDPAVVKVGREAILRMIENVKTQKAENADIKLQTLAPFRLYRWLLEPDEVKLTDGFLQGVLGVAPKGKQVQKVQGSSAKQQKLEEERSKAKKRKLSSFFD